MVNLVERFLIYVGKKWRQFKKVAPVIWNNFNYDIRKDFRELEQRYIWKRTFYVDLNKIEKMKKDK